MNYPFEIEFYDGKYYIGDNDVTGFMEQSDKDIVGNTLKVNAECDVDYQTYEPQTWEYPGCKSSLTITKVTLDQKFSDCFREYLENYVTENFADELLEKYENEKYERSYDNE